MIRMNKCRVFVFCFLFLAGCSNHIIFEPNELPDGHVGQEYSVPITISGGSGPIVDLSYEIHPSNSGLNLVFAEKKYHTSYKYNKFTIQGKPKSQGVVIIYIRGGVIASAGQDFERIYEIKIAE